MIYLIGSLRNPEIPNIANRLREAGHEVFDDWYAAGPEADDKWRDYERGRGHSYMEGLKGHAARNVYEFDRRHLDRADVAILALPAGKSGHLELGWALGRCKRGYILLDSPERWDVMYQFATGVYDNLEELLDELQSPADQLHQISSASTGVHVNIPSLGISCACSDCVGVARNLRGNRPLRDHDWRACGEHDELLQCQKCMIMVGEFGSDEECPL